MPRNTFTADAILDAARAVVAEGGARALTVDAVARASAAPVGSIYHRFASVDDLIARLWLRAARRSQEEALAAARSAGGAPADVCLAVALALYDRCLREPDDAALLGAFRLTDLLGLELDPALAEELRRVNEPIDGLMGSLARGLFGRAGREARDLLLLACVDLPFGAASRYARDGGRAPRRRRERLAVAVAAAISGAT
jgi:AcrR family transcriptional regulator